MKKRLGLICIAVLIVILFSICMIWIYRKMNTSIPTLEEVARMSDEEATSCLTGHTQKELYAAWGHPTMCLSGMPGDSWSLPGDGWEKVIVYYALGYYGEPDDIPVTYVRTPTVQESEDGEAETQAESLTEQTEGTSVEEQDIYSKLEADGWEETRGYYDLKGRTAEEFVNFVLGEGAYEQEPYATYVNPEGEVQMVLWTNSDLWCGIRCAVTEEEKKNEEAYGFVINEKENRAEVEQWRLEPLEKYTSVDDFTFLYSFLEGTNVQNIQGNCEYDGIGRLLSYEVTGDCIVHDYETNQDVIRESEFFYSIDYIYYDNGMIEKIYSHSSSYFGTSGAFRRTIYDESNREVYLYDSVSGAMPLEEYYLYEGDSDIPFCMLIVDGGSGATGPAQLSFYGTEGKE